MTEFFTRPIFKHISSPFFSCQYEGKNFIFDHCLRLVNFKVIVNDRRSNRQTLISDRDWDRDRKKVIMIGSGSIFLGIVQYTEP